jgi:predicted RNA-binding protein with PUA-like domain
MPKPPPTRRYWLFKSEPDQYSWQQLVADRRTCWNGVRNYQARNLLRDTVQLGDGVLFYHSNADPMVVAGIAKVVRTGYPDHTQFDAADPYFDAGSQPDDPRWYMVDIAPVAPLQRPLARDELKRVPELREMVLLQRGSRLSVQPVTTAEWQTILRLGGAKEAW